MATVQSEISDFVIEDVIRRITFSRVYVL